MVARAKYSKDVLTHLIFKDFIKLMENTPTTTTNGVNLPAPVKDMRETLPGLLEKSIPWMEKKNQQADAMLDTITGVDDDETAEDVTAKLAAVREVGAAIMERRMEMTKITDAFKDVVMEFERPFDAKSPKSKYSQKRKFLEDYQQRKLEERRKQELEAAKRKEVENLKVDLRAKMLENLTQMVVNSVKRVDAGSKDYFEACTLEEFDKKAEVYKGNKPKLKQADYDVCFNVPFNHALLPDDEFHIFVSLVSTEEPYEKWNTAFIEAISPIINQWRAMIPDLKAQKEALVKAKVHSQAEAEKLQQKQNEANELAFKERQMKLDQAAEDNKKLIQEDAGMQKMSNDFQEQAATQGLQDAGRVKLILKFTDPKLAPKGFLEIVYQVMSNPDFQQHAPMFQKRDKSKKLMFDDKGRPVYIDSVQWWIDFWLASCNGNISGTTISEDAKVVVRK
jgi:hypothetical protein